MYPSCIQKKYEKVGWKARKAGGFAVYNSLGLLTSFNELRASEMNHDGDFNDILLHYVTIPSRIGTKKLKSITGNVVIRYVLQFLYLLELPMM